MSEFDDIAHRYDVLMRDAVAITGEDPDYFAAYKIADLAREASAHGIVVRDVLDFGCGVGNCLVHLDRRFAQARVRGVDPSTQSARLAASRARNGDDVTSYDGGALPYADASFDLVLAACVFHHIAPDQRDRSLREIARVMRPGALLMIYEHNPRNPLTVRAVRHCAFDHDAVLLYPREIGGLLRGAGLQPAGIRHRVFFPRWLSWLRGMERLLAWLPLGAQYYAVARRPAPPPQAPAT